MTSLTKRVSLAAASAVVLSLSALPTFAADLDLPPPPPPMPELRASVSDWTGVYVGGQIGMSCFEATFTDNDPASADPFNFGGCAGMGGVYGGYNYQVGSNFVIGLEGEYNAAFNGDLWYQVPPSDVSYSVDDMSTVRLRAGWLANPDTLLYVTGGYGWLGTEMDAIVGAGLELVTANHTAHGWVFGGGIEHAITNNFHVKAEYLYGDFGGGTYDLTPSGGCAAVCDTYINNLEMHAFRVGASYNFNFGGGYSTTTKW